MRAAGGLRVVIKGQASSSLGRKKKKKKKKKIPPVLPFALFRYLAAA
jgi:hypothetical protein